jgi:murein DD-endopeptidase MepM/ murein hydrolase activator NlpD
MTDNSGTFDDWQMKPNHLTLTLLLIASALMLTFSAKPNPASALEVWRVPLDQPILVNEFRQPNADWSAGHRGVDYLVSDGEPVFASHAGVISFSGFVVNRSVLSIRHENGLTSTFEPVCGLVPTQAKVETGDKLGQVCTSPEYQSHCGLRLCLHFSLRNPNGYLSPLVKLGGLSPSRLKPWGGLTCSPLSGAQC